MKGKGSEKSLEAYVMLGMLCAAAMLYIFYSFQYGSARKDAPESAWSEGEAMVQEYDLYEDEYMEYSGYEEEYAY